MADNEPTGGNRPTGRKWIVIIAVALLLFFAMHFVYMRIGSAG